MNISAITFAFDSDGAQRQKRTEKKIIGGGPSYIYFRILRWHKVESKTATESFLINNNPRKLIKNSVYTSACVCVCVLGSFAKMKRERDPSHTWLASLQCANGSGTLA